MALLGNRVPTRRSERSALIGPAQNVILDTVTLIDGDLVSEPHIGPHPGPGGGRDSDARSPHGHDPAWAIDRGVALAPPPPDLSHREAADISFTPAFFPTGHHWRRRHSPLSAPLIHAERASKLSLQALGCSQLHFNTQSQAGHKVQAELSYQRNRCHSW